MFLKAIFQLIPGAIMRFLFVFCVMFLLIAANFQNSSARPNLKNLDKPIELNAGESKRMYVIFNHSSHKKIACRNCHHEGLPGNRYAPCTNSECHAITAPSSREPLSVYMAYHAPGMKRSCYGCHKSLAAENPAFRGCKPCHQSMGSRKMAEKMAESKK